MTMIKRSQVLREILEEKKKHKQRAEYEAELYRLQIAEKAPIYADMQGNIAKIYMDLAREAAANPDAQQNLQEMGYRRVMQLKRQAEEALQKIGLTPEDLQPKYACPICRDTGFVGDVEKDRCTCVQTELMKRLYDQAGIENQTFDNFNLDIFPEVALPGGASQRKWMQRAAEIGKMYAGCFPNNKRQNLLFTGYPGLGKTYLMNCIAASILLKGYSVMRLSAYRMFEIMRKYHRGLDDGEMEDMLSVELLTLDDLGTEPMMENITIEYLFTLLSERKNKGLSTIIATNLGIEELMRRYTERIASRLCDQSNTLILRFEGQDLRHEKR